MEEEFMPYLCGGTFFVLLTEAKRKGISRRQLRMGIQSRTNNREMLEALIRLLVPSFQQPPAGRTFDGDTTDYRACKVSYGENLPFDDELEIQAFDKRIKGKYASVLVEMDAFIKNYLYADSEERMHWLIQAVLDLIEKDESVTPETLFYLSETPTTKAELLKLKKYYLSPLLLSVWHFIIMHRPENERGRETFEKWHERADEKYAKWRFTTDIGKTNQREFDFDLFDERSTEGCESEPDTEPDTEPAIESESEEPTVEVYEAPYYDPITKRQVVGQFHVENHGSGIAAGIVYGGITVGGRKKDGE